MLDQSLPVRCRPFHSILERYWQLHCGHRRAAESIDKFRQAIVNRIKTPEYVYDFSRAVTLESFSSRTTRIKWSVSCLTAIIPIFRMR